MNILIIGGTGILSTDICAESLKRGYSVNILNRGQRSYALNEHANLIKCDIRTESVDEIRKKITQKYYNVVIDFLSYNPEQLNKTLECIKGFCDQYIFISSATAYLKSSEDEVITEKTPIGNKTWDYAYQKALSESYLKTDFEKYVKYWTIIRPYVTYNETRIPYAIVEDGYYWALINRINIGKPIILWDSGKSACTITNTKDFAVGVIGTFCNQKAYMEAFHITSDESLTWKKVLNFIIDSNGKKTEVIDLPTKDIIKILPEFRGILCGDKATNMLFDNTKIKSIVPEFKTTIFFKDGIKLTLNYLNKHQELQKISFVMEGRLDYLCHKYYKKNNVQFDKKILSINPFKINNQINSIKDQIKYYIGRYFILFFLYNFRKKLLQYMINILKNCEDR